MLSLISTYTNCIYIRDRGQRDISLNAHYIIFFKNPRDRAKIKYLARQMYPDNTRFIEEAYVNITETPQGYIQLDLKQSTPDLVRVRTSVFPDDPYNYVYKPVSTKSKRR